MIVPIPKSRIHESRIGSNFIFVVRLPHVLQLLNFDGSIKIYLINHHKKTGFRTNLNLFANAMLCTPLCSLYT